MKNCAQISRLKRLHKRLISDTRYQAALQCGDTPKAARAVYYIVIANGEPLERPEAFDLLEYGKSQ